MNSLFDKITDWLKEMLVGGIMDNLSGLFDSVNDQVGEIAGNVGASPASFSPEVFSLIRNISESVIIPIAGLILTFIACYELIQLIIEHNNLANFETWIFFKWIFKTSVAVMLITNTFNITMAVFDVSQHVVTSAAGIISGSTAVDASALENLEETLMGHGSWSAAWTMAAEYYRADYDVSAFDSYLRDCVRTYDRNLSDGQSCADSVFLHIRQPGTEPDRTELSAFSACSWFSGIPDTDLRGNLCSYGAGDRFHR